HSCYVLGPDGCPVPTPDLFFFQAEDGIRDFHVTGVQTCALPLSPREIPPGDPACRRLHHGHDQHQAHHQPDGVAQLAPGQEDLAQRREHDQKPQVLDPSGQRPHPPPPPSASPPPCCRRRPPP